MEHRPIDQSLPQSQMTPQVCDGQQSSQGIIPHKPHEKAPSAAVFLDKPEIETYHVKLSFIQDIPILTG